MSWHLDRARQIIIRQIDDRTKALLFWGDFRPAVTGRIPSKAPLNIQLPRPRSEILQWIKQAALAAHQPSVGDILPEKKVNRDEFRLQELKAAEADLGRQISHYQKLGKDKPADHEYNLVANGLLRIKQEWPALHSYLSGKNLKA